ncbi:hypothetical protein FZEAL_5288 [Fusarium zealandicum]|uniref:Uncharacterized protein n=1 Tax=Fusarium zealandicum TaxID=1053134 RepID=A0A8H4XL04_9HYPO|nr:hypothetical protein FZEAL_5288 [Fusarium zealandicum]
MQQPNSQAFEIGRIRWTRHGILGAADRASAFQHDLSSDHEAQGRKTMGQAIRYPLVTWGVPCLAGSESATSARDLDTYSPRPDPWNLRGPVLSPPLLVHECALCELLTAAARGSRRASLRLSSGSLDPKQPGPISLIRRRVRPNAGFAWRLDEAMVPGNVLQPFQVRCLQVLCLSGLLCLSEPCANVGRRGGVQWSSSAMRGNAKSAARAHVIAVLNASFFGNHLPRDWPRSAVANFETVSATSRAAQTSLRVGIPFAAQPLSRLLPPRLPDETRRANGPCERG